MLFHTPKMRCRPYRHGFEGERTAVGLYSDINGQQRRDTHKEYCHWREVSICQCDAYHRNRDDCVANQ